MVHIISGCAHKRICTPNLETQMKTVFFSLVVIFLILSSLGCHQNYVPPGGIGIFLTGEWSLREIITKKDTTAANINNGQTLEIGNDTRQNFLKLSRNGKDSLRLIEDHRVSDEKSYAVDIHYQNGEMIRFFLKQKYENNSPQGVYEIQSTKFMRTYSAIADTVRYNYIRVK